MTSGMGFVSFVSLPLYGLLSASLRYAHDNSFVCRALLGAHLCVAAVQLIGSLAARTTLRRYEYQVHDQLLSVGVVTGYAHFCAVVTLMRDTASSGVRISEGFYSATLVVNTLLL